MTAVPERFKFVHELSLTGSQSQIQEYQSLKQVSELGKLVFCHFSDVKEQTQNEADKPFKSQSDRHQILPPKRDQRCYYKDKSIRIYSRGGSEYVIPMLLNVDKLFPIENGIIIKAIYDKDQVMFDAWQADNNLDKQMHGEAQKYAYFTIQEHPLNDLHPLRIGGNINELLQTSIDILHVEYKLPMVVLYDKEKFKVIIGMLKQKVNSKDQEFEEKADQYIKSIDISSRNPDIINISKDYQLWIDELYSFAAPQAPSSVHIQHGLYNPSELVVSLYFQSEQKLEFFSCDIRQPKYWYNKTSLSYVQDVVPLRVTNPSKCPDMGAQVISQHLAKQLQTMENEDRCPQLKLMTERLSHLSKDLLVLSNNGKTLSVYTGQQIVQLQDFASLCENYFKDQNQAQKFNQIERLLEPSRSKVTLQLSSTIKVRITMKFLITDYLVKSILSAFRVILPESVYHSFYQDLLETYSRQDSQGFQFQKLSDLIFRILKGEQFSVSQQRIHASQASAASVSQASQISTQSTNAQTQKPAQTIQTKILRSSTTSFGVDSLAQRRKTQNQQQLQASQQQQVLRASQIVQQKPVTSQIVTRTSTGGIIQTRQQASRRVTSGSIDQTQPFSFAQSSQQQPSQQISQSANPFQDLLNSEFHKEHFQANFSQLLPLSAATFVPNIQPVIEHPPTVAQVSISPTKSSINKPSTQKITSSKQSSAFSQPTGNHERRNSNLNSGSFISQPSTTNQTSNHQVQQSQQQPSTQTVATISVQLQTICRTSQQDLIPYLNAIFDVLHLLYEDLKLNKLRDMMERPKLAQLMIRLALTIDPQRKAAFVEYYNQGQEIPQELKQEIKKAYKDINVLQGEIEAVPHIFKWLQNMLKKGQTIIDFPFPLFYERSRKIVRFYEILNQSTSNSFLHPLLQGDSHVKSDNEAYKDAAFKQSALIYQSKNPREYLMNDRMGNLHPFEKALFCLKEENLSSQEIRKYPCVVTLPIMEIIRYAKLHQSEVQTVPIWPESLYKLIQREDILKNTNLFDSNSISRLESMHNVQRQASKKFALNRGLTNVFTDYTIEEQKLEKSRREMETNIFKTTADLINSGDSIGNAGQDQDSKLMSEFFKNRFTNDTRLKEAQSLLDSSKEMTLKLEQIQNRETMTEEAFNTEKQKLLDRVFLRQLSKCTGRGALMFGSIQTLPTEVLHIPKINQTGYAPMNESYMQVEIKDDAASKEMMYWPDFHNGVASALRIAQSFRRDARDIHGVKQQHTRNWIMYHKPAEPKFEHGGFLLAIGLLGQLDTLQPTDMYQHLKTTHDATAIGLFLGRSASKIGSMDDVDTRTLCIHIPYLLPPTMNIELSLAIQSAAVFSAGLLYKGTQNRVMTEMLLAQIGRKPLSDKAIEREGYALASGFALGLVNLGVGKEMQGLSDLQLDDRLIRFVEGGKTNDQNFTQLSQNFNHENLQKNQGCSSIKEGDMVNVHITASGALVALALIHLKTNNSQIANQLIMPQSFFSLESVRPSFLLLKSLCRNLIMWDSISCSKEWVSGQIPQLIREIYENDIATIEKKCQMQSYPVENLDYTTVSLCYVNIVAGTIFSLGFKYLGTGNRQAFQLVHEYTMQFFRKIKISQSSKDAIGVMHTNFTKNQVDKNTVETCLCVCAFAMSMIMAGTGDLDCFRALRILRKRFEHDMNYGFNMAIHMSTGFLFLGTGAFTFSRSNMSIAALLAALYPVFPQTPSDNRYHLQALRHFYVLAIETRLLEARDIDTGASINISMEVSVEDVSLDGKIEIKTQTIQTPEIINGHIISIDINDPKYYSVKIDSNINFDSKENQEVKQKLLDFERFQKIVYVKQKFTNSQTIQEEKQNPEIQNNEQQPISQSKIVENFISQDPLRRDHLDKTQKTLQRISQIQEPTIKSFCGAFLDFSEFSQDNQVSYNAIENVLLAQHKDPFCQLTPGQFFKIQDALESVSSFMNMKLVPSNLKEKMKILQSISDNFYGDKLEFLQHSLMFVNQKDLEDQAELLKIYSQYSQSHILLGKVEKEGIKQALLALKDEQNEQQCTAFTIEDLILNQHKIHGISIYILSIAKQITDSILNELVNQGEHQLVQKYKEAIINGYRLEEGPLVEINESIKLSIQSLIGDNLEKQEKLTQIVLPLLLKA